MVSLRRRRLLGYTSDVPLPDIYNEGFPVGNHIYGSTPLNAYPMPMDEVEQLMEVTNQDNIHPMHIDEVVKPVEVLNPINAHPPPMGEVEPPREVTNPMNMHLMPLEIDLNKGITEEIESPSVSPCSRSKYQSNQPSFSHQVASEEQDEQITEHVAEQEVKPRKQYRRKNKHDEEETVMRGVYYRNKKWQAAIKVHKKQVHLATLSTQTEAAHIYDRAAYVCGRETNFPLPDEEKEELNKFNWKEFLVMTKSTRKTKRLDEKDVPSSSVQNSSSEGGEQGAEGISASDEPDSSTF